MNILFQKLYCKRHYGVELEVGNEIGMHHIRKVIEQNSVVPVKTCTYRSTINNSYWDVKHDGSCGKKTDKFGINEGGYEVNSFKAYTAKDLQHICAITKKLKKSGLQVNNNCGVHIHVDASDFNEKQMGVFIYNWLIIEDIVLQSVPDCRRRSKYCCKNLTSRIKLDESTILTPELIWEHYRPKTTKLHDNMDRRLAVNIVNYYRHLKLKYYHRPTIEFRFPEGTLISGNIKNWVKLFLHFVNNMATVECKTKSIKSVGLSETLNILGIGETDDSFSILSPSLYETKIWFLKRIIRFADYKHLQIKQEAKEIIEKMGVV